LVSHWWLGYYPMPPLHKVHLHVHFVHYQPQWSNGKPIKCIVQRIWQGIHPPPQKRFGYLENWKLLSIAHLQQSSFELCWKLELEKSDPT